MTPRACLKSFASWLIPVVTVPALYWFCLRFVFPGYCAPLSAFHVDFYDYAAVSIKPFFVLFTRYPRPVSFAVAKLLADAGFPALLMGQIAIALASVLFTLAFARRAFGLQAGWESVPLVILYVFVLFAHPEFYAVHRHDLPAECAYLFLMVSLLAWISYVRERETLGWSIQAVLISFAVVFAALSAFSKETYFVSALCLVAGLALSNRRERPLHLVFLLLLLILDCSSYAWNRHMGWPPANLTSSASEDYRVSLAPADLANTYYFYLSRMLNPALIQLPLIGIGSVWRDRGRILLGFAFPIAGLAALIPHAILPNHLDSEYAWLGAPLFLAPLLLMSYPSRRPRINALMVAVAMGITVTAVIGPGGYWPEYQSIAKRWLVEEDQKGAAMVDSLHQLHALHPIPQPARVLVVGLEDATIPWEVGDFVRSEFGGQMIWSVVLPESIEYRRSSPLVEFPHAGDVKLENFDRVVRYNSSGHLIGIRSVASIPASEPRSGVIVPALAPLLDSARTRPNDPAPLLASARLAGSWGLWADALNFVDGAKRAGAPGDSTAALSGQIQTAIAKRSAKSREATLIVRPVRAAQGDESGLSEADLFWTAPQGVSSEIHVNAPDGVLFARGDGSGQGRTGKWVKRGTLFFLQDVSGGKPLDAKHTLARVTVE